jgi:hypothetical protein
MTMESYTHPIPADKPLPRRVADCMPEYRNIPDEFKRPNNPWVKWQVAWFFDGLKSFPSAKEGVDQISAMRHLDCIQRSWDTKHEHKEAAVAYLASLWLLPTKA